jgi:hypothetical protein
MTKRINPSTKKPFKEGDKRTDGFRFRYYLSEKGKDGFFKEKWQSNESRFRNKVGEALRKTKDYRFRDKDHPARLNHSDLDIDFLIRIFPKDKKCPVFNFEMDWGGETSKEKDTSPSLDRIDPTKGYTKNNVQWVSNKVNRVKSDQSMKMLIMLGNWAEKILKDGIESGREFNK